MSEAETRSFLRATYPEALVIALLTAGMYWASFVLELAYLTSYGLPPHLVEVNLHSMFKVVPIMAALALSIILIESAVHSFPRPGKRKVSRVVVILFFPVMYAIGYGLRWEDWPFYTCILAGIVVFELVLPILIYRNRPTFDERLVAYEEALYVGLPAPISLVAIVFLTSSYAAHVYGQIIAQNQTGYLVFDDMPDVAVIRVYSDSILAVPFDRKTRTVKSQVVIRKIGTDSSVRLTHTNIGPLTLPRISIKLTVSPTKLN